MYYSFKRQHSVWLLLSCLVLIFSQTSFASLGGNDWREITPGELQMKTPSVEADADAEAIFWEVRIDDSSSEDLAMNHYVRVKIFTERGREKFSKFDIPFVKGIKIKDIAARVIKPDGTAVEITKADIFEREIVKANKVKVKAKSFAIPNIEPGVIVEYKYREVIQDAGASGMRLQFQRDIPVQNMSYYYKPYNKREPSYQSYNFTDTKFVKDEKGYYLAKRTNVPALKQEPQMPPEDMARPWMLLQGVRLEVVDASAFSISFTIKDPSNLRSYWGSVSGERAGLVKFMNKSDKEIKKTAEEVTATASTPDEKLRKLYEFVQTQIKNSTFDPSLTDEQRKELPKIKSVSDVLKNKQASGQYIDMLFGAMANALGFETRIAFAANRSQMFFEPEMTNEAFIHPAAVAVQVGNDWKFFNPGLKFLPYGMLVWYEEDVWALLAGEKQYAWIKTPLTGIGNTVSKRAGRFKLLEDGSLEGSVRIEHTGQTALTYRLDNYDVSENQRLENMAAEIRQRASTAEVSNVVIENVTDAAKPLIIQYKVRVPNYAQKTGKRLFIQPGFFEYGESPLFSTASRKYDIYFHFPWSEKDDIEIQLPKGFALDNAETPASIADPQKIASLDIRIGVDKEQTFLKYTRNFYFGGGGNIILPVGSYSAIKKMFDAFNKSDTHTITLKQK